MAYELREGQGSLFKNDKQNDRQPDLRGNIMINGTAYRLSAWKRTSQSGNTYLSLSAEAVENTESREQEQPKPERPATYEKYEKARKASRHTDDNSLEPQEDDLPF